ncbi:MAG: hypothetical protein CSA22_06380 [Deltaproteobacteria bacterium]|nr:MAG: hypothetical protein CSA22_06380 [Deltaproteobacteria bacterium]
MSVKRLNVIQTGISFILWLLVVLCTWYTARLGGFSFLENPLYDLHFTWRGEQPTSGRILLVTMDEESAVALGRKKDSWDRINLSRAISHLCAAGADVIGIDLVLSAPDTHPEKDRALADTLAACGNVVLARSAQNPAIRPLPIFAQHMLGDGFIDLPVDRADHVLRSIRYLDAKPLKDGGLLLQPSFSLELARAHLNLTYTVDFSDPDQIWLGGEDAPKLPLPVPDLRIDYCGDYRVFDAISYADVVMNRFSEADVSGRIVIIGSTLKTDKDFFYTPYTRFSNPSAELIGKFGAIEAGIARQDPGISCHAHALDTLLRQSYLRRLPDVTATLIFIVLALVGALFFLPVIGWIGEVVMVCLLGVSILSCAHVLFRSHGIWMAVVPLFALVSGHFTLGILIQKTIERRRNRFVTGLFGKYVSAGVVTELMKGDIDEALVGSRKDVSILFSDLRGFTSISEQMDAKTTGRLLNHYFSAMIPTVFQTGGTLDKLMGDAVMAFWGAPVPQEDHPNRAAESALAMVAALSALRKEKGVEGVDMLDLGIGLNSGEVTAGNLGSRAFMDYTIIGDAVNLASRLEGLNKVYGTRIIASESTAHQLPPRIVTRELDIVRVKGKADAVTLYEICGTTSDVPPAIIDGYRQFENALHLYRNQEWDAAETAFQQVETRLGGDGPSALYIQRIQRFRDHPPPKGWHAVTTFSQK